MKSNVCIKERVFELRPYKKSELAMMYFPDSTKDTALRIFTRWIKEEKGLWNELMDLGYNKFRQYLLKREVEAIVRYFGEPF